MEGVELSVIKLELELTRAALCVALRENERLKRKQEKDDFSDWPEVAPTLLKKMRRTQNNKEEEEDDAVWLRLA
jgi:hypothetical protein